MTKIVLYWDGIIANKEIAERYTVLFQKILEGNYKEANLDLKKLPNYRIYSARVNDTDRLLFTTVKGPDNRWYLLLLGEVLNHDYDNSPFLKKEILASFLDNKAVSIIEQAFIGESSFQVYTDPLFGQDKEKNSVEIKDECTKSEPWSFYNGTFIRFNSKQQSVLQATLPVIVSGVAGSGKSCVAMSMLANGQTAHTSKRLYLSQSPALVTQMKKMWERDPSAKLPRGEVFFQTYADLLYEFLPELKDREMVGQDQFFKWLDEYIKIDQRRNKCTSHKNQSNVNQTLFAQDVSFKQKHLFYQECRIIAVYDEKAYLALGDNQSLIHTIEEKKWLFKAFVAYKDYMELEKPKELKDLKDHKKFKKSNKRQGLQDYQKQFDPAFFDLKKHSQFDLIVIDEAQDLSHCQLQQLLRLAENGRIAYCMDSHQSLSDSQSKRPYLLHDLLQKTEQTMQLIELPGSYRCPEVVTAFANHALNLKFLLTGGLADKNEPSVVQSMSGDKKGRVEWYNASKMPKNGGCQGKYAVITTEKCKAKAKILFDTPLVFTVEEVKGLEYKTIIAYNLLAEEEFKEANRLIVESQESITSIKSKSVHRPKKNQRDERFVVLFNQLFTAFTRSTRRLVVIQEESYPIQALIDALKKGLPINDANHSLSSSPQIKKSNASWEKEGYRLLDLGKIDQAKGVFINKLDKTETEFTAICSKRLHDVQDIQLEPTKSRLNQIDSSPRPIIRSSKPRNTPLTKLELKPESKPQLKIEDEFVTSKTSDYLNGLLATLTIENLKLFFEHKNWERLMFSTLVNSKDTFVSAMFQHESKLNILNYFLTLNMELMNKITVEILCKPLAIKGAYYEGTRPLYWFSQSKLSMVLFHLAMTQSKQLEQITVDALCEMTPSGHSVLFELSVTPQGRAILNLTFNYAPHLYDTIPLSAWVRKKGNDSALSMLRECEHLGILIINKLPISTQEISEPDCVLLHNLFNDFSEIHLNALFRSERFERLLFQTSISPFYILFSYILNDANKSTLFFDFLEKNKASLFKISIFFCRPILIPGHQSDNVVPLYMLLNVSRGRDLLKKHEFLLKKVTIFGLLLVIYSSIISSAIHDSKYDSTCKEDKKFVINKILSLNPSLASTLSDKCAWSDEEINSLFLLSAYDDGHECLAQVINDHPNVLVDCFNAANLFSCAKLGYFVDQSIFSNLIKTETGLSILSALFSQNPSVLEGITQEALIHPLSYSSLNTLAATVEGRSILHTIFNKNPGLAQDISMFHWIGVPKMSGLIGALHSIEQCPLYGSSLLSFVSNDTKRIDFDQYSLLFDVWSTFNHESLSALFSSEHFESLFFHTEIKKTATLYTGVIYRPEYMTIFIQFLQDNPHFLDKINSEILGRSLTTNCFSANNYSVFHMLLVCATGEEFLKAFPSLFKKITIEILCRPCVSRSAFLSSPLFELSMNYGGDAQDNALLKQLVEQNPSLLLNIPVDALYSQKAELSEKYQQSLMNLCEHKGGRLFLTELLAVNPGLIKSIPVEAWCRAMMFLASSFDDGHILIEKIITKHPTLFKGTKVDFLRYFYSKGSSLLVNLAQTNSGVKSLKSLFVNNPQWMKQLTALDLCGLFVDELGQGSTNTVLLLLTSTESGREILSFLFRAQPGLAQHICFNSWIFVPQEQLSSLISVKNCEKYGAELVACLPKTAREISVEDAVLLNKVLNHSDAAYLSLLFKRVNCGSLLFDIDIYRETSFFATILAKPTVFPIFLESLVSEQPAVLNRITVDVLKQTVSMLRGERMVKVPLLILMCLNNFSQLFLNQLVDLHPELLGTIPAKTWCYPLGKYEKYDTNLTALFLLTKSSEGMKLVRTLLNANVDSLCETITLDVLCFLQPDIAGGNDSNHSILSNLVQTEEGIQVLYSLLCVNPDLLNGISVDILCREFSDYFCQSNQFSLLYFFSLSLEGRFLLSNLLNKNPLLAKSIPQASWDLMPTLDAESPIAQIKKCGCYNVIINLLSENLQQIPQSIASSVGFFSDQKIRLDKPSESLEKSEPRLSGGS